ncbi:MAG: hypothetical protein INR66_00450 [Gordonia polyisoprenivorans]|nr:hypothetical protein [Gordonia polyisoprenivorans]
MKSLVRNRWIRRVALLVVGLVVGAAITATIFATVVNSDSDQPSTTDVTTAITDYVDALNTADATTVGTLSCGLLKQDFDRTGAASVHQQLTQAAADRGPAHVHDFRNVSIDGDRAMAAGMVTYTKDTKTQDDLTVYGLRQISGTWKLCWSTQISNYQH